MTFGRPRRELLGSAIYFEGCLRREAGTVTQVRGLLGLPVGTLVPFDGGISASLN
jgi:hypothetical protein